MYQYFFCIIACLIFQISKGQTIGIGFSAEYRSTEKVDARQEALLNAMQDAIIKYGGVLSVYNTEKTKSSITKSTRKKTDAKFDSERKSLKRKAFSAFVSAQNIIDYDTMWVSKRKYKIRAEGNFVVQPEKLNDFIPLFEKFDFQIYIEVNDYDCYGRFYQYSKEYFSQKKNCFVFSRQKFFNNEGDYALDIYNDRIILSNLKTNPKQTLKIYEVMSCNEFITGKFDFNPILDEIERNIFFSYIMR